MLATRRLASVPQVMSPMCRSCSCAGPSVHRAARNHEHLSLHLSSWRLRRASASRACSSVAPGPRDWSASARAGSRPRTGGRQHAARPRRVVGRADERIEPETISAVFPGALFRGTDIGVNMDFAAVGRWWIDRFVILQRDGARDSEERQNCESVTLAPGLVPESRSILGEGEGSKYENSVEAGVILQIPGVGVGGQKRTICQAP